jgi:alkylation response protein AidB-like acyl-CoA dehydrogenase
VESCELFFEDHRVSADAVLGGTPGRGFAQMMKGAPLMIVGEGTNEIQHNVIVHQLIKRNGLDA